MSCTKGSIIQRYRLDLTKILSIDSTRRKYYRILKCLDLSGIGLRSVPSHAGFYAQESAYSLERAWSNNSGLNVM